MKESRKLQHPLIHPNSTGGTEPQGSTEPSTHQDTVLPTFEKLLPALLHGVSLEPDFQLDKVEAQGSLTQCPRTLHSICDHSSHCVICGHCACGDQVKGATFRFTVKASARELKLRANNPADYQMWTSALAPFTQTRARGDVFAC